MLKMSPLDHRGHVLPPHGSLGTMSCHESLAGITAVQNAEFSVKSCVSVREEYKTKLRSLVEALLPRDAQLRDRIAETSLLNNRAAKVVESPTRAECKAPPAKRSAKLSRHAVVDRLRLRATLPAGKELQILGDWLLLLRAASVNVIESIVHWRQVVHQDRPVPFEGGPYGGNYLLQMAHDTNFLNQCADLVEWLGFELTHNPFIVCGELENATSETEVHRDCRPKKPTLPPPPSLVKPLVSILPEDDVVDGGRIMAAQNILRDEEALYGVWMTSESVRAVLAKEMTPLSSTHEALSEHEVRVSSQNQKQTVFEEIAAVTKFLRASEHRFMAVQREYNKVVALSHQLELQIETTTLSREPDTVRDHRVWEFREHCRQTTLRTSHTSRDRLQQRIDILQQNMNSAQSIVMKHQQRLRELELTRDDSRRRRSVAKRQQQQDELERRKNQIQPKTIDRHRDFKTKRARGKANQSPMKGEESIIPSEDTSAQAIRDTNFEQELQSSSKDGDYRVELEQKRRENIEYRDCMRNERAMLSEAQGKERDRQRDERSRMFLEDRLAMAVENRIRRALQIRSLKGDKRRCSASPIFSTVQSLGGIGHDKKYRVAGFRHRAKGYSPDGLQFVAYDPSSSSTYSMLVSSREYNTLGYGRTHEGLVAFCQWLCLIYEKRKRQFRLVWAGAPCPPPLRIREYDHRLICIHKEGIRMTRYTTSSVVSTPSPSYHFVSVYVRVNTPYNVHVVLSTDNRGHFDVNEFRIPARNLFPVGSVTWKVDVETGNFYLVWLHAMEGDVQTDSVSAMTRIYSGELPVFRENKPTRVHIYDASRTEYELRIAKPRVTSSSGEDYEIVVLLKRQVNPYDVRLPHSAFGELLSCIHLEESDSDRSTAKAVIQPNWKGCLAKYVRAIRMTKFGCKIDGIFCVVVAVLVQQKTEFRASLVFEVSPVRELAARYSLRISLSSSIRCRDAFWCCLDDSESEINDSLHCTHCLQNRIQNSTPRTLAVSDTRVEPEVLTPCASCIDAQKARLDILWKLVQSSELVSRESADYLFHGSCDACGKPPPPIAIIRPQAGTGGWADSVLRHYFHFFNLEDDLHDGKVSTSVRATLEDVRICVLEMIIPIIPTHSNIEAALDRVRTTLLSMNHDASELPAKIVFILDQLDIAAVNSSASCESLSGNATCVEAIRNLALSIIHIGTTAVIRHEPEASLQDGFFNFDAYLVSEALLVEATHMLLDPHVERRPPGETVGASSWDFACEVMRNPRQLSHDLQTRYHELVMMDARARYLLEIYESHAKWPKSLDEVRVPFQPLLSCLFHVMYVQRLLAPELDGLCRNDNACRGSLSGLGYVYEVQKGVSMFSIKHPAFWSHS